MDIIYHYPPELLDLLVDTIPLLSRSKQGVLDFLRGAGVEERDLDDLSAQVRASPSEISKYKITRTVLTRLNEREERTLRERREIIKRVVEFEDFSSCWPDDQLKAKGLVAQVQKTVNVKDSFTRMKLERESERKKAMAASEARLEEIQEQKQDLERAKKDFYRLFAEQDVHKRGRLLEVVMGDLCSASGILVRESFHVIDPEEGGIVEQVDGLIKLNMRLFLVEIKWLSENLGKEAASAHLVRVYHRPEAHGLFISATPFTDPALKVCREGLQHKKIIVLCTLQELVQVLEANVGLKEYLVAKVEAVIAEKDPFPNVPI